MSAPINEPEPEDMIAELRRENLKYVRNDPLIGMAYWRGWSRGALVGAIVAAAVAILVHFA